MKHERYRDAASLNARLTLHRRFGTARAGRHRRAFDQFGLRPPPACRNRAAAPASSGSRTWTASRLAALFPCVTPRRHEEALQVAEAQPMIDYILSGADASDVTG